MGQLSCYKQGPTVFTFYQLDIFGQFLSIILLFFYHGRILKRWYGKGLVLRHVSYALGNGVNLFFSLIIHILVVYERSLMKFDSDFDS